MCHGSNVSLVKFDIVLSFGGAVLTVAYPLSICHMYVVTYMAARPKWVANRRLD